MFEPGRVYRRAELHREWDGTTEVQRQGGILDATRGSPHRRRDRRGRPRVRLRGRLGRRWRLPLLRRRPGGQGTHTSSLITHAGSRTSVPKDELAAGRGQAYDFVFCTRNARPYTRQNISERGIEEAGVRAGLGEGIRSQVLRHSFCTFVAESGIPPNEGASLTGHDEQTWWRNYVQPRRDSQSRKDNIARLTAFGVGVRREVDQRLTSPD